MRTPTLTLASYARDYLARCTRLVRPQTRYKYEYALDRYVLPYVGALAVTALTRQDGQAFIRTLEAKQYAPRTIRFAYDRLNSLMNDAADQGVIAANPIARLGKHLHRSVRAAEPYLPAELQQFLATAATVSRWNGFFQACGRAALRPGEGIGLQGEDCDLPRRRAMVRRTIRVGTRAGPPKDGPRVIELSASLVQTLAPLVAARPAFLFLGRFGPVSYTTILGEMRAVATAAGLPYRSPHALRKSCAVALAHHDVSIEFIRRQLGHSSVAVTQRYLGPYLPFPRPAFLEDF